jgi:hypothetical protein
VRQTPPHQCCPPVESASKSTPGSRSARFCVLILCRIILVM